MASIGQEVTTRMRGYGTTLWGLGNNTEGNNTAKPAADWVQPARAEAHPSSSCCARPDTPTSPGASRPAQSSLRPALFAPPRAPRSAPRLSPRPATLAGLSSSSGPTSSAPPSDLLAAQLPVGPTEIDPEQ